MTKETIEDLLAECLRYLYIEAGLTVPKKFKPRKEADRISHALIAKGMGIEP